MDICDCYLFWVQGFSAVGFGNYCECLRRPDHNVGRPVLGCSRGQKRLVSGRNGAWHSTWHSQSSTEVSAWSQQSQPVCMCWDHRGCRRCAACFFWLLAPGTWRQRRRRTRRRMMMRSRVQGARALGSGFGWLQALSSGPSLSGWISSHWPLVWNKNNKSLRVRYHMDSR